MEFEEIAVPCFSIGSLLAPVSWTMDVQSRYIPFSVPVRSYTVSSFRDPLCWSSNTVRFERLDSPGNILYVTELFAFHQGMSETYYGCIQKDEIGRVDSKMIYKPQDEATTLTRKFQVLLPQYSRSSPLHNWTVKVTEGDTSGGPELQDKLVFSPRFKSKVAWLYSQNYEVFLHISLDASDRLPESITHAIELLIQDAINKYRKPLMQAPNVFLHSVSALDSITHCGNVGIPNNNDNPMSCSCDPLVTDERPGYLFCVSAIYTSVGKALLVLRRSGGCSGRDGREYTVWNVRQPKHPHGPRDAYLRLSTLPLEYGSKVNDGCQDIKMISKGRSVSYDLEVDGAEPDCETGLEAVAAALRHLVYHKLRFNTSEDLCFAVHRESRGPAADLVYDHDVDPDTVASSGGAMSLRAVCLTTFLLNADMASIYNYRSVEYAFEKHVEAAIHTQCCGDHHEGATHTRDGIDEIELVKLCSSERFVPSDDFLHAVQEKLSEAMAWDTGNRKRTLEDLQATLFPSVPPRSTLYGLRKRSVPYSEKYYQLLDEKLLPSQRGVLTENDNRKQRDKNILFVVQLIAPRVNSRHAIVLVAAVEADTVVECEEVREGATATTASQPSHQPILNLYKEAATLLARTFSLEFPHPKRWVLSRATWDMTGFFFRQGYLLLHIPSGDPRYCDTTVRPNAAKCFTSLGSLIVHTSYTLGCQKVQDSCSHDEAKHNCLCSPSASFGEDNEIAVLEDSSAGVRSTADIRTVPQLGVCSSGMFKSLSAVWTLLRDGRTSDEFLDYYIFEFHYLNGMEKTPNKDKATAAVKDGQTVLGVRKRFTRSCTNTPGLLCGYEGKETSAWLDLGPHHRLYVCARECGVGRVLLIQASILLSDNLGHRCAGGGLEEGVIGECEETSLESWLGSILAEAIDM